MCGVSVKEWVLVEYCRDVDSAVALSGDVGISSLILLPGVKKLNDGFGVEFGDHVIGPCGRLSVHVRKSNLCWRFDVEDVGLFVPAPLVVNEVSKGIVEDEGSMFVEGSEEGGAAGSSVEPDEDGVVGGGALGGEEEVVHVG